MTEAPKPLPCPFCGGEAKWISGGPGCAYIKCTGCPAETGDGSIPRILAAWNTRAAPPLSAALELPEVEAMAKALRDADAYIAKGHYEMARNITRAALAALGDRQ